MNVIDWLRETGDWMHRDRPDIYQSPTEAMLRLEDWMNSMRQHGPGSIETGGHALLYRIDDGVEDWTLTKKISTCEQFADEEVTVAYSWTENSGTMTHGPNLPDIGGLSYGFLDNDDDT